MNRLSGERATYLRHSAYQRIDWYPWSEEAFERAKAEDRPVFLSSGAIWCHWCHVMAKECFEDDEVIALLNANCINIKLDRDERPDIDRIYQKAVATMGAGGGWPLSVFLTPDKEPFFGGTYFPPEDGMGRPGFKKVIRTVVEFYKSRKGEISEYVQRLMEFLKPEAFAPEKVDGAYVDEGEAAILSEFDAQNGGFASAPKFPMPGALEFLMGRHFLTRSEATGYAVKKTLLAMAKGGFHDHLGGGFHRYSVDEAWAIPHFEKMADDNAWLLRNYSEAYGLFGHGYFRDVAEDIIRFVRDVLSDPEGGFFSSQDADVTPEDEGGYFTWSEEEFKKALNDEEYRILSLHLLHERGSMHHDRSKKVLSVAREPEEIARATGVDAERVRQIISAGKEKLLRARSGREAPLVDRTFYTSLNGMLVSAHLKASRSLGDEQARDAALRSLARILGTHVSRSELLHTEGVKALLDDYVHLIDACIAAYEVTGDLVYRARAGEFMEQCIARFWDKKGGGFFDTDYELAGVRLKGIEDIPHPSANSLAVINLLKLSYAPGGEQYYRYAQTALESFSLRAKDMGIHSGYFLRAVNDSFTMIRLHLETPPGSPLAKAALASPNPFITITYGEDRGLVTPCGRGSCYEAISSPEALRDFLGKPPRP